MASMTNTYIKLKLKSRKSRFTPTLIPIPIFNNLKTRFNSIDSKESGITTLEYILVAALIAAISFVGVSSAGAQTANLYSNIANAVNGDIQEGGSGGDPGGGGAEDPDLPPPSGPESYAMLYSDYSLVFQKGDAKDETKTFVKSYTGFEDTKYDYLNPTPWKADAASIKTIVFKDEITPSSTALWFYSLSKLSKIEGLSNLNTSKTESMRAMFSGTSSLTQADISGFNTSNVTDMSSMFNESNLYQIDVSKWDFSKVENMSMMFAYTTKALNVPFPEGDYSRVTDTESMFYKSRSVNNLDIRNLTAKNLVKADRMFSGCSNLTILNISGLGTNHCTGMSNMFENSTNLSSFSIGDDFNFYGTGNPSKGDPRLCFVPLSSSSLKWENNDGERFLSNDIPTNKAGSYHKTSS